MKCCAEAGGGRENKNPQWPSWEVTVDLMQAASRGMVRVYGILSGRIANAACHLQSEGSTNLVILRWEKQNPIEPLCRWGEGE
jgi:hypothetical protein